MVIIESRYSVNNRNTATPITFNLIVSSLYSFLTTFHWHALIVKI